MVESKEDLEMTCLRCGNYHVGKELICPICGNDNEHQFEYEVVRVAHT